MEMSTTDRSALDLSQILRGDRLGGEGARNCETRQKVRTKGWQVASIPDNVRDRGEGASYIRLTENRYADGIINVYEPGRRDEMHCHPGSEHLFLVVEGELHI